MYLFSMSLNLEQRDEILSSNFHFKDIKLDVWLIVKVNVHIVI